MKVSFAKATRQCEKNKVSFAVWNAPLVFNENI